MTDDVELVVIGGGLAGLTAGLFAARYGRTTLVLETLLPGGHLVNVPHIEDFPGFPTGVPGYDLGPMVQEQAEAQGCRFELAEVTAIQPHGPDWHVIAGQTTYRAQAVIVASGTHPRLLDVPGAAALAGRGVSHCATCDGPLFRGRAVGVVGGGDHALHEALILADYASQVVIFHQAAAFSGQAIYQKRVEAQPKIEVRPGMSVVEVFGQSAVTGVRLRDRATGAETQLDLAALFVYIGLEPNTAFLSDHLRLNDDGTIPVDIHLRTELPGVFAAGDARQHSAGHAITAAADGATAAIAAHRYLHERARERAR